MRKWLSKAVDRIAALLHIRKEGTKELAVIGEDKQSADYWKHQFHSLQISLESIASLRASAIIEGIIADFGPCVTERPVVPRELAEVDCDGWYRWRWDWAGKPGREWQKASLTISHEGLLKIVAGPVFDDPVFLSFLAHKQTPLQVNIQSLLYADASSPTSIWVLSPQPFTVDHTDVELRLSAEVIRKFREKQLETDGFVGSIPAPESVAAIQFYRDHPDLIV